MTPGPAADLALVVASTRFEADDRFRHGDAAYRKGQHPRRFVRSGDGRFPEVVAEMGQCLYDRFYLQPHNGNGSAFLSDPNQRSAFLRELAAANRASSSVSEGWSVVADKGTEVVVAGPDWEQVVVAAGDFVPDGSGKGRVRLPASLAQRQQGYFHFLGEVDKPPLAPGQETRFYFHLCREGAIRFVSSVTTRLNAAGVPFRGKVVSDPQLYRRADAGVLYLRRDDAPRAVPALRAVWGDVHPYLCRSVPRFTKPLAPGLGVGESPGGGESFGMHRCRLVAEGLWLARERGEAEEDGRLRAVEARLAEEGLDPRGLHLQGGNDDVY